MSIKNINVGKVYMITPDEVFDEDVPAQTTHKDICEQLLSFKYHKHVEFSSPGDYGKEVASEYNTICIRMASIINNVSVINYPERVNEFQLEEFKKFKVLVDEYNAEHKGIEKAGFLYYDSEGKEASDLGALIEQMEAGLITKKVEINLLFYFFSNIDKFYRI